VTSVTAGELLCRVARTVGIDAVYGQPLGALDATSVPADVADLFAAAHRRVHGLRAAVHRGDGILRLPADDVGDRHVVAVASAEDLLAAVPTLCAAGEVELVWRLDPGEPVTDLVPAPAPAVERWIIPPADAVGVVRNAARVTVLAGPGVIRHAAVSGLHDLAVATGVGVLNTWGAKGVFDWRSRHHLATVGLQEHDFALGGLGDVDLIIATGLDPLESPGGRWELAPVLHLHPGALAPLAEDCRTQDRSPAMPPLRTRLAQVTQRGWALERAPLAPSRITLHYAECLAARGLVAADAGTAGFWVARTFGTTRLGAAIVPSAPTPGLAAACVAVARIRRPAQPALAVVDGPVDGVTAAVVDAAATLGVDVPVEAWSADGERLDADAHRARLQRLLVAGGAGPGPASGPAGLAADSDQMVEIVDAAGPVVAWT
jgi:hypothetical protein